ncbi:DNA adenine methylase [Rhizobium pusense]|uniref:DNA adenine methylase n=1 Tax=Agrobacterium pusense TaxID=648995 RepID=UPI002449A103|nr:DNA adenine methylase [Agrobacterium pusense]MDH0116790.1 DNA adenine methylase [Agrobacterium pusense]
MKQLPIIVVSDSTDKWSTQNAASPFRYPGGKGFLTSYLARRVAALNTGREIHFCEPFCGGAGAALNLLAAEIVSVVHLNDADLRIHSAWRAMLDEPDRFIEAIHTAKLDMPEWYEYQRIAAIKPTEYSFEVGFAAFYMNRTTRSGIIERAGPIGGYDQTGKWKIDARFNRDRLASQVDQIRKRRDQIVLSNIDALAFLDQKRRALDVESTLFFVDPPYVKAGGRLYLNGMTEAKHIALADLLTSGTIPHWVLTYDDAPLIREIYRGANMSHISVNYSLQQKRKENEILVLPVLG